MLGLVFPTSFGVAQREHKVLSSRSKETTKSTQLMGVNRTGYQLPKMEQGQEWLHRPVAKGI